MTTRNNITLRNDFHSTEANVKVPTIEELEAVAAVIKAIGFDTLAAEFIARPGDRERIVRMATNIMRRDGKMTEAGRFNQLATWTLRGLWVSA